MRLLSYSIAVTFLLTFSSCSVYNFTGTGKIDAKTFQVNFFPNNAELIEPGLDRTFTLALQDLIQHKQLIVILRELESSRLGLFLFS